MQIGDAVFTPLASGKIRMSMGGLKTLVDYKELWGVVFMLGEGKYRDDMLPVRKTEMMVFSRKHVVLAERDIKQGETLNVWCEVNVPKTVVEAIAEENGAKVIYQEREVIPTTAGPEKGIE